jgi:catechol 2,3-dioxygenase-like lactoylglutathione lyase family enzyme
VGQSIRSISLLVRDYDEAIAYFTGCLRFALVEDTPLGDGKRWVLVAPPGDKGTALLLGRAATAEQESRIGNQTGGRVFLFLHTGDFWRDYHEMKSRGVWFTEEPRREAYGTVVVFRDLYGNKWDLVQTDDAERDAAPAVELDHSPARKGRDVHARVSRDTGSESE